MQEKLSESTSIDEQLDVDLTVTADRENDWSALHGQGDEGFYQAWIQQLFDQIPGAFSALLITKSSSGEFQPAAIWPAAATELNQLSELAEQVIEQGSGLVTELDDTEQDEKRKGRYGVAFPVYQDGELLAISIIAAEVATESKLKAVMQQLQWSASWLELKSLRGRLQQSNKDEKRLSASVDLFSRLLGEPTFSGAGLRLVTELAVKLNCTLVSLGETESGAMRVCHLSNSAEFGKQMNLVRGIEAAMNEAADQHEIVLWPLPSDKSDEYLMRSQVVNLAHRTLAQIQDETLLTIPLFSKDKCVGAVTLQRDISQPFSHAETDYCESLLALSSASLEEKRQNDKALIYKIVDAGREQFERLFGPGYLTRKLVALIAVCSILFFSIVDGEYKLSADAQLKPVRQQAVVTPFDGYIDSAPVRAGDIIKEGDLLVQLDDRDLQLERFKWLGQLNKFQRQYQEAVADHNRAKVNIIGAQVQQASAQLKLAQSQLQRAKQIAPFDGLLVSGDLSQRLGGTAAKGELLFEISPLNDYRIDLLVKESRIADVEEGQTGIVHLSALPHHSFAFSIGKITPITSVKSGGTYFIVEANLDDPIDQLRPGMEGVGKISIDKRKLIGIWTQEMMEWLRLKQWAWWG